MTHGVIMAGGAGTRLWPLSRQGRPKQLLRLVDGRSLLRAAYERLTTVLPPERIYVITGARHLPLVAAEVPEVPAANLLGEPEGRDTANAVGLAAAILHEREPDAVMGVFTADHVITPVEGFTTAVSLALRTAADHPQTLVTLGITVAAPETAFGYVKRGPRLADGVYRVAGFTEKPDAATAGRYAAAGDYYWNSGMFAWRTGAILEELRLNLPLSYEGVTRIARVWDTPERAEALAAIYPGLPKISIDYAVMERAREVIVVEMDCAWRDVGSWVQLGAVLPADAQGNTSAAARVLDVGSRGVTVVCEDAAHLVVTVGLEDVVVVHAPDATLVCRKRDAQALKELLARVEAEYGDRYL